MLNNAMEVWNEKRMVTAFQLGLYNSAFASAPESVYYLNSSRCSDFFVTAQRRSIRWDLCTEAMVFSSSQWSKSPGPPSARSVESPKRLLSPFYDINTAEIIESTVRRQRRRRRRWRQWPRRRRWRRRYIVTGVYESWSTISTFRCIVAEIVEPTVWQHRRRRRYSVTAVHESCSTITVVRCYSSTAINESCSLAVIVESAIWLQHQWRRWRRRRWRHIVMVVYESSSAISEVQCYITAAVESICSDIQRRLRCILTAVCNSLAAT